MQNPPNYPNSTGGVKYGAAYGGSVTDFSNFNSMNVNTNNRNH